MAGLEASLLKLLDVTLKREHRGDRYSLQQIKGITISMCLKT